MIIRKVKMVNFRYFTQKTIDFQDSPVVLLSAANGVGKTTTVDAIEWCLTGKIGRLKASFDTRSSNAPDRKKNAAGILKNCKANDTDPVWVEVTLFDGKKEIVLCREQTKDVLDPGESTVTIDGIPIAEDKFLEKFIGSNSDRDNFYNFHFCDIQKSFNVQSTKRDKLKEFFKEFITNYDAHTQVAKNLDVFVGDVQRYIEDEKRKITPPETIQRKENELAKILERATHTPYPTVMFYPGETTAIATLSKEALTAQQKAVRSCGFLAAKHALDRLVKNETAKRQLATIQIIVDCWETMGESIQRAMAASLHENTDAIYTREQELNKLKKLSLTPNTILRNAPKLIPFGNEHFTQADFDGYRQQIDAAGEQVKAISGEIELLSGNNKVLSLLSDLIGQKHVLVDYRDSTVREHGAVRCPICGSETFAQLDADSILKEAVHYIEQNNAAVNAKAEAKAALQAQIDDLYQSLVQLAKQISAEEQQKLSDEIAGLNDLYAQVRPYFDAVRRLEGIPPEDLSAERAKQLQAEEKDSLLTEVQEQDATTKYRQLLTVLGYRFEGETPQQTLAKVQGLITGPQKIENFSYELLVSKLNAMDGFLANQDYQDQKKVLDQICNQNHTAEAEIKKLENLKDKATQRANRIRELVQELSSAELKNVGPALSKYYNKLARVNIEGGIKTELKDEGISLTDQNGKNIVNILSNGQISVFMLAYFFAAIHTRNDREKMKIFFIDDLTACMDDVNMLAFLDILKYQMSSKQMSSKKTMDQLFFITCDERISDLLEYKLNGRGISLYKLGEKDLAE